MFNERGHTELHLDVVEIDAHVPADTADAAFLVLGNVEIHFDASAHESRDEAYEQIAQIRRQLNRLEAHLRVIRVAPEHAGRR